MGIKEPVSKVPWNRQKWNRVKYEVRNLENNLDMENSEIQTKILEILREHEK